MAFTRALLDELEQETRRQLGPEADPFLASLGWAEPGRRVRETRAERHWVEFWMQLAEQHPELFHGSIEGVSVPESLAYLYVRAQYPAFVPALRLRPEERELLNKTRTRIAELSGLRAMHRAAPTRLVRAGCPILERERERADGYRAVAASFAWTPTLQRTVLVYEDALVAWRRERCSHLLVGTLLHEESHTARHLAAGSPAWSDGSPAAGVLDELAASQVGFLAEYIAKHDRVPNRRELESWNRIEWPGAIVNQLCRALWPAHEVPDLTRALNALAIAALQAESEDAILSLLETQAPRRRRTYWLSLLNG